MHLNFSLFILFFVFISFNSKAESVFEYVDTVKYPYHLWNEVVIAETNTAKDVDYMSDEEKNVIWLTNLARFDGSLFAKTFLKEYLEKNNIEYTDNVKSLFSHLRIINNLTPLKPDRNIYLLAEEHAKKNGRKGKTGHDGFNTRAKNSRHSKFSENCEYGDFRAIDILITLLIDEGVPSLGHRKNILNQVMTHTAVSIQPHTIFKYNCVIEYGG